MSMCDKIERMDYIRPQPGDVVVWYVNFDDIDVESARNIHENVQKLFPNNKVVGLPDSTQIIDWDKAGFLKAIMDILRELFPNKDILSYIENDFDLLLSDEDLH